MYSTWHTKQLKDELKKRGASVQGKKIDLIERLEAYDRNFNFESVCEHSPDSPMELPDSGLFRDVNSGSNLPPLTKQHIYWYFSRFNKKTNEAFRLYESRYLLVLRSYCTGDNIFLKGLCKASMKQVQYEVNLKIKSNGDIEEASCECAAGSGKEAHCKHVGVVMYGVEQMIRDNTILMHTVCTQRLQTFHKPRKPFYASPIQAHKLPSKRKIENIIFHPYNLNKINKRAYNTRIRNICIGATTSTMPLKQRYAPANPYGILNDHKYNNEDARDVLCKKLHLKYVAKEEIISIEIATRGQSSNPLWYENRQDRITASRFHTVCHLTPQRQKVFAKQMLNAEKFKSRATTHGIVNESVAIKSYMEQFDLEVNECSLFLSEKYPFLGASPDGLLGDETIIEVKCPYASRNQFIDDKTVPYLIKENMS